VVIRRPCEAAARTLPLVALMFLPIAIGIPNLYPWSHAKNRRGRRNPQAQTAVSEHAVLSDAGGDLPGRVESAFVAVQPLGRRGRIGK